MQSENFDNKIKEAAEQHHPTYDEMAWSKMENLLNKHLPQKEGRRRRFIIFFLLCLLLAGGGVWMLVDKPWQTERTSTATVQKQQEISTPANSDATPGTADDKQAQPPATVGGNQPGATLQDQTNTSTGSSPSQTQTANSSNASTSTTGDNGNPKNQKVVTRRPSNATNDLDIQTTQGGVGKRKSNGKDQSATNAKPSDDPANGNTSSVVVRPNNSNDPGVTPTDDPKKDQPASNVIDSDKKPGKTVQSNSSDPKKDNSTTAPKTEDKKTTAKKTPAKKTNSFFFHVGAGPDISSVGFGNPGKWQLLAGGGLGYTIADRWSIRTGFYTANKIYNAAPDDYKPAVSPPNPNYLEDISANCKVYEIPLSLSYLFGQSEKHRTFASVGLSSFIMKSEEYKYWYTYPGNPNPVVYYTHYENNKNKHYFSVLSLSGGYQHRFSKTFSLSVEPYLKLPLAGVGYGKVKLNSAGVLVSVNVSPFQK